MSIGSKSDTSKWIRLNVGGKVFQTTKCTLMAHPESFFGRLGESNLPSDKDETGAYLIDRDPKHFRKILNYLRDGYLDLDGNETATKELLHEAEFYTLEPLINDIRKHFELEAGDQENQSLNQNTENAVKCETITRRESITVYSYGSGQILIAPQMGEDSEIMQAIRRVFRLNYREIDGVYEVKWWFSLSFIANRFLTNILTKHGFTGEVDRWYDSNPLGYRTRYERIVTI